jgi:hypothetical protein
VSEPVAPEIGPLAPHVPAETDDLARVLYIGGCGRSGSTLLDRILGQVQGLWSVGEIVHIWRRGLVGNQLCGCGESFRSCPFWTRVGEEAFGGWDSLDADELLRLQHRVDRNRYIPLMLAPWLWPPYRRALVRYTDLLSRLYRAIQKVSGARMIVDSTKHASYAFLLRRVPGVRIRVLHLTRDARGVAYSWTKEVQKPEVVERTEYMPRFHPARMSVRWLSYNWLFHVLRWTGTRSRFVRYESVVRDTREELSSILAFAGRVAGPEELSFIGDGAVQLQPTHTVAGNPMRFKGGRLDLRLDEQWRERLRPVHRAIVSVLTWPLMRRYGYRVRRPG